MYFLGDIKCAFYGKRSYPVKFVIYWQELDNNNLFLFHSLLVRQLVEPVNWMKTIQNIFKERTCSSKIYEVGPGRQLRAMINRIDRTLLDDFTNLETWHVKCQDGGILNLYLSAFQERKWTCTSLGLWNISLKFTFILIISGLNRRQNWKSLKFWLKNLKLNRSSQSNLWWMCWWPYHQILWTNFKVTGESIFCGWE